MEIVDVEPARVKKITDEQRALMCRYSSIKPDVYHRAINEVRKNPEQQCFEQDPFIAAWNFNVDVKMITVPARVLPMPEIIYDNQYRVTSTHVRDAGRWELTKSTQFHKPADFPKVWAMINLSSLDRDACIEFYHEFSIIAQQRGIDCAAPAIYEKINVRDYLSHKIVAKLEQIMTENEDCHFILVILPNDIANRTKIYQDLKKLVK